MTPATIATVVGWCALHLCIGVTGTILALRYARRRNLVDEPGERRSHQIATPRGGGIAIVCALLVACIVLAMRVATITPWVLTAAGLFLVAAIGWLDDHRPLSPWSRLLVHAVAAGLLACAVGADGADAAHVALAFLVAMALTNIWNFMDGINGIAATQAILVAAAMALLAGLAVSATWLALALVASTLGFLPFNFPNARIFLGDVGSGAIGYALAALVVTLPGEGWRPVALALLPLSAFAIDATLTLGARIVRGERWWAPHVQHAYQRLARRAGGHAPVVAGFAAWTIAAVGLSLLLRRSDLPTIMAVGCVWYLLGTGIWFRVRNNREWAVSTESRG